MKLDTHLHNLIAQFINAHGDQIEQERLHISALKHLKERAPAASAQWRSNIWLALVEAMSIRGDDAQG